MRSRSVAWGAVRLLAVVGLISLAHCAAITTVPEIKLAPHARDDGLLTLIGAVHVHSFRSHDSTGSDEEIETAAQEAGLDFVLFTDHRRDREGVPGREWQSASAIFIPGFEVNLGGGSLFLFGAPPEFDASGEADEVARRALEAGAVLGLGHLETMQDCATTATVAAAAVEAYNLHAAARDASSMRVILGALFLSAGGFIDQLSVLDERTLAFIDRPAQPRAVFLGGDAHANIRLLWGLLGTFASYDDVFRSITTHVLATERSRAGILTALARGRSYGVFARQGDARGFDFRVESGDAVVPMGDEARLPIDAPPITLRIRTPMPAHLTLIRNGEVVSEADGVELMVRTRLRGRYRAITYAFERPWIVSSAIDVVDG
jgi:hypothetical protein